MTTLASIQDPPTLWLPPPAEIHRITVDQYDQMVASGAFDEDAPIELLGGLLVRKMSKNPGHSVSSTKCLRAILELISADWHLRKEEPVRIPNFDEPEPDISLVKGHADDFANRHPGPGDITLLIEVADSSLARDRGEKSRAYARAGIPAYWIVNLVDRCLEVYTNPVEGAYPAPVFLDERQSVELVINGRPAGRIAVEALLPAAANTA